MSPMTDNTLPEPGKMIGEGRRTRALELAVQLRAATGPILTNMGYEALTADTIDTAKAFEAYLRGGSA